MAAAHQPATAHLHVPVPHSRDNGLPGVPLPQCQENAAGAHCPSACASVYHKAGTAIPDSKQYTGTTCSACLHTTKQNNGHDNQERMAACMRDQCRAFSWCALALSVVNSSTEF